MINPKTLIELKHSKDIFEKTHPKFASMFGAILSGKMIEEGSTIEIIVTDPNGHSVKGNMKVKPSDMEFFHEFSKLSL